MKRAILLSVALLVCGAVVAGEPKMSFKVSSQNLGKIEYKSKPRSVEYRFVNDGDAPLIITRTSSSCTCTKAKAPRKPIPPKGEGVVTVTYNPNKDIGPFNKGIHIYTNTKQGRAFIILQGEVCE